MNKLILSTSLAGVAMAMTACGGSGPQPANAPARLIQRTPIAPLVPLDDTMRVSTGQSFSVGLDVNGNVYAWGTNRDGQLGISGASALAPVAVPGLSGIRAVRSGGHHTLALHGDGTVFVFGNNYYNQFGNGSQPVNGNGTYKVPTMSGVQAVAAGLSHSLALTSTGYVWGWGQTPVSFNSSPLRIVGLSNVQAISAGWDHSLAVLTDGRLMAWGGNKWAQLGLGDTVSTNTPTFVPGMSNVRAVSGGRYHSMALTTGGAVFTWGSNPFLQLGIGGTINTVHRTPTLISGLSNVRAIASGPTSSAALLADGTIKVWGNNSLGQLGTGNTTNSSTPITLAVVTNAVGLAYGNAHLIVLKSDGSVYAVGNNATGQLGNNTSSSSTVPIQTSGIGGVGTLNLGTAP